MQGLLKTGIAVKVKEEEIKIINREKCQHDVDSDYRKNDSNEQSLQYVNSEHKDEDQIAIQNEDPENAEKH